MRLPYLHPLTGCILVSLLIAGCNLAAEQEVIFVTATPSLPTNTPAPTATPTPPPTPTTAPQVLLQMAEHSMVNGFAENAIDAYRTVLTQGAPDNVRAAAAFQLGQAAVREGLFSDALEALTLFITQFPGDGRVGQAHFLRGDAHLGLAQWAEAIADFQQYLTLRPGLIDSYAHERIGDAQLALSLRDEALISYDRAINARRSLVPLLILREKVAQIHLDAGAFASAVEQYDAILNVARNAPYRASIEFSAAQVLIAGGDRQNGLARMQMIFDDYESTTHAYRAMNTLESNGFDLDDFARGRVSFFFGDYQTAIEAFNLFTTQTALGSIPPALYLMLGRAYREVGNPNAALTAFQTVIDNFRGSPEFGEALLEQGRTHFLSGDIPAAIAQYLSIADNFSGLEQAPEALWRAGFLYGTNGSPEQSRAVFQRLADAYPGTEQAISGLFIAASAAYNAGDPVGAETLYARLATTATGEDQAAAYWWVARLAQQRGDDRAAADAFRLAVDSAPDSYFSARAQDITTGREPFDSPPDFRFTFDDAAEIEAAEGWLRATFGITQEGPLWPLPAALAADPNFIRGQELWAVAAYEEADTEFSTLLDNHREDPLASYQLAIFLRGIGAFQPSIVGAANVIRAAEVATIEAPPYIARMRYPVYYLDVVLPVAQKRDIDPLLMFSLIRHESLFDTNATAGAGEKGLTQVIPSTGEYIAQQLQWPDYQHSDLFRPFAGVEFGGYYLWEQLSRFDNNEIAALAAYNAGPGRALDWYSLSGGDPDLFVTTITIDSTRLYVQRIYSYYNIYRALYGA